MTLNVHRRRDRRKTSHVRVWLDGVDVADRCFYADGRRGVVRLYQLDAAGKKFIERPWATHWAVPSHLRARVATEERRGRVHWKRTPLRSTDRIVEIGKRSRRASWRQLKRVLARISQESS